MTCSSLPPVVIITAGSSAIPETDICISISCRPTQKLRRQIFLIPTGSFPVQLSSTADTRPVYGNIFRISFPSRGQMLRRKRIGLLCSFPCFCASFQLFPLRKRLQNSPTLLSKKSCVLSAQHLRPSFLAKSFQTVFIYADVP